jgi:hypothetical protein
MKDNIRGTGKVGCLIWLLILGAAFYVGFKFAEAQWAYLSMSEDIHEVARFAAAQRTLDIEPIQREVERRAEKLGISIYPEDIKLEEVENNVTIDVSWEVEFAFPFYTYYQEYSVSASHRKGL